MKSNIVYLGDCYKCLAKLKKHYKKVITIDGIKMNNLCRSCVFTFKI